MGWFGNFFGKGRETKKTVSDSKKDCSNGERTSPPQISETAVELEDGIIVPFSNIKEISDGRKVLGAPNHPLIKAINAEFDQGFEVVYILFVTKNGPSTAIIPVADHSSAVELIERIKSAKATLKKQKSLKVIVGECAACHRKLRVKEHAVKPEMSLTCKCGEINKIRVSK